MVPQKELLCLKKRGQLNIRKLRALFGSENLEPPPTQHEIFVIKKGIL